MIGEKSSALAESIAVPRNDFPVNLRRELPQSVILYAQMGSMPAMGQLVMPEGHRRRGDDQAWLSASGRL